MATYLIGDIQGCYSELRLLMDKVNFTPSQDQLWFTGDLVARGPDSLKTLRLVKQLGESAKVVLGNHDLHLLAVYAGIKAAKKNDRIDDILAADDAAELMDWLASMPLVIQLPNTNAFMSHAGISPQWHVNEALQQAALVQQKISSSARNKWLKLMYGNEPNNWHDCKTELDKFRFTINSFTRMRFCFNDGSLEFNQKDAPQNTPHFTPWYVNNPNLIEHQWVFGHWASLLGQCPNPNAHALDTGCVWGGEMTMLRWEDKQRFTVKAQQP